MNQLSVNQSVYESIVSSPNNLGMEGKTLKAASIPVKGKCFNIGLNKIPEY